MKTSTEGFQQCYNAQLAVEGENQLIVAAEVSANASDQGQMLPRLDEVKADYGAGPETLLADAGYCNEADLASLEERGVDGYLWAGRATKRWRSTPRHIRRGRGWPTSWRRRTAGRATPSASCRRRPRLDQAGAGFSPLQRARPGPSAGRVGPGVSGAEHQADARAGGGVKPGNSANPPCRRAHPPAFAARLRVYDPAWRFGAGNRMFHCPQTASPPNRNILRRTLLGTRNAVVYSCTPRVELAATDGRSSDATICSHRSSNSRARSCALSGPVSLELFRLRMPKLNDTDVRFENSTVQGQTMSISSLAEAHEG